MPRILGLLLALPVMEIVAFALVASLIGLDKAILLQVAISAIGIAMLSSLFSQARVEKTRRGGVMAFALDASTGRRGLAGLLFAVPGFITDVIGLLTLAPTIRRRIQGLFGVTPRERPMTRTTPAPKAEMLDLDAREWREVEPVQRPDR